MWSVHGYPAQMCLWKRLNGGWCWCAGLHSSYYCYFLMVTKYSFNLKITQFDFQCACSTVINGHFNLSIDIFHTPAKTEKMSTKKFGKINNFILQMNLGDVLSHEISELPEKNAIIIISSEKKIEKKNHFSLLLNGSLWIFECFEGGKRKKTANIVWWKMLCLFC